MAATDELETLTGVGPTTAEKLRAAGFGSYRQLAIASPTEIATAAELGELVAGDIIDEARERAELGGFETGVDLLERRSKIEKLQWLVPAVDVLLGGGVESQSITEVYGAYGTGKSQITHQLVVNAQLPREHGGLGGSAVFIDSENTFRPGRIDDMVRGLDGSAKTAMMDRHGVETETDLVEAVLDTIYVAEAFNANHQMLLAEKITDLATRSAETRWPIRLVCVDSLTGLFRAEYPGRGNLAERQQKLNKHLHDLVRVATLHNAVVVVTNQVQSNPDAFFGDPTRPIGGNVLGHASTFRLYLRRSKKDKRIIKLVDAPNLPDGEAVFRITGDGVKPE
ncbi:DNA repair and recombination protein RadA [Haladaptatus caseinilyticus]|uniref:DNA repair and recombination protein RadA n=1 Tax=Haladaptatus caseinilyticus TaxID=2993314 RepID=UPI00224ABA39|nr:DNA repair and recombination protein RadA [Haladaptatus caseinilyticus]